MAESFAQLASCSTEMPKTLTLAQAADMLHVCTETVSECIHAHGLPQARDDIRASLVAALYALPRKKPMFCGVYERLFSVFSA